MLRLEDAWKAGDEAIEMSRRLTGGRRVSAENLPPAVLVVAPKEDQPGIEEAVRAAGWSGDIEEVEDVAGVIRSLRTRGVRLAVVGDLTAIVGRILDRAGVEFLVVEDLRPAPSDGCATAAVAPRCLRGRWQCIETWVRSATARTSGNGDGRA